MTLFAVTKQYDSAVLQEFDTLVAATRFAAAAAMHTGRAYSVVSCDDSEVAAAGTAITRKSTFLMAVQPAMFDFRRTTAESALKMKTMAHDLWGDIHTHDLKSPTEGP